MIRSGLLIAGLASCFFIFAAPSCEQQECTDEDGDGFCAQSDDCNDTNPAVHPDADEVCDGVDNDCDDEVDEGYVPYACGEGACAGESQCVDGAEVCTPGSPVPEECSDGLDNDCDGLVDGADPDCCIDGCCPIGPETCNGIDDDCDGQIDEDFDLLTDPAHCGACDAVCLSGECVDGVCLICLSQPEVCDDRIDNDCDGLVDMADSDCATCGNGIVEGGEECDDGNSISGDGCENDCTLSPGCTPEVCDGVDNDCDRDIDEDYVPYICGVGVCMGQSMCLDGVELCPPSDPPVPEETPDGTCDLCYDALDNDCDGMIDMADSDCATCPCIPGPELCSDRLDNDCDGLIDCADLDCSECDVCGGTAEC